MKPIRALPILSICLLTGCAGLFSRRSHGPTLSGPTPGPGPGTSFHDRFDRFEITPSDLHRFERMELHQLGQPLTLAAGKDFRLELVLGDRHPVGKSSRWRTASRYRLLDGNGRVAAEAESVLALADVPGNSDTAIVVLSDNLSGTSFIAEEQSWSAKRYLLLQAGHVSYVKIPAPASDVSALPPEPRFLGLYAGRLYLKLSGHFYAIPLESLETETDLAYSIG